MAESSLSTGHGALTGPRLRFANFVLDPARAEFFRDGVRVPLRPKAFLLLLAFVRRPAQVVAKEELIAAVWPGVIVTDDSLSQCIREVRLALGESGSQLLRTVPRRGYMFDVPVEPDEPGEAAARRLGKRFALALLATALLVAGIVAWKQRRADPAPPLSLVVLPFSSQGSAQDGRWFADAVLSDLTLQLGQVSGIVAISRDTALRYRGGALDSKAIAGELGVRYVVHGNVRYQEQQAELSLTMVEADTGIQRWNRRFAFERRDLADSLREITGEVARSLSVQMHRSDGDRAARLRPGDIQADDLAMQGWSAYFRGATRDNLTEASSLFERAVARDPRSISAWGGIAVMNGLLAGNLWGDRNASMARLEEASRRLQTLDENDVYSHFARYFIALLASDYEGLLVISTEMTRRFPSNPQAHFGQALASMNLGRFDECVEPTKRALRIGPRDPGVPLWSRQIGTCYFLRGEYAEAARYARIAVQADPSRALATLLLAASLARNGQKSEATQMIAEFRARNPEYRASQIEKVLRENHNARYLEGRGRWIATLRELGLP